MASCTTDPSDRRPHALGPVVMALTLLVAACGNGRHEDEPHRPDVGTDEIARLQALGYVDVVEGQPPEATGVRVHDSSRVEPGLTHFTTAFNCTAQLVTATGETVRSWTHEPCTGWSNTVLLPSGEVLVVQRYKRRRHALRGGLLKLSLDARPLWHVDVPVHHDAEPMAGGRITALTHRWRVLPWIDARIPVDDHFITILGPTGQVLEEASIADLLRTAPTLFAFLPIAPTRVNRNAPASAEEIDLLHANSVAWMRYPDLVAASSIYATTNVMVSLRHQNTIAIFDWTQKRLVWAWGQGHVMGPHDATPLRTGNVLIFDNGLGRGWSRVIELDPRSQEIVWEYKADPPEDFYTLARGSAQRLANGNTLIAESDKGRIFEVTPAGEIVWSFVNPSRTPGGQTMAVVRARRVREHPDSTERFELSD